MDLFQLQVGVRDPRSHEIALDAPGPPNESAAFDDTPDPEVAVIIEEKARQCGQAVGCLNRLQNGLTNAGDRKVLR